MVAVHATLFYESCGGAASWLSMTDSLPVHCKGYQAINILIHFLASEMARFRSFSAYSTTRGGKSVFGESFLNAGNSARSRTDD